MSFDADETRDPADPGGESERLRELASYAVLDTPPEEQFERLVALAANLCGTSAAVVTLVDRNRQWFKASVGMGLKETDRAIAFCAITIEARETMVVDDALRDPRFAHNPLVLGPPYIRFYAGVPLVAQSGHALGTLAVIDFVPREISDTQLTGLATLAEQVMVQLDLRRDRQLALSDAQAQRRRSQALLSIAGRVARIGGWEYDPATGQLGWSDEAAELHHQRAWRAATLDEALAFYGEPERSRLAEAIERCIADGTPFDLQLRMRPADGEARWMRVIGEPVRDEQGRVQRMRGAIQDVTDLRRAQDESLRLGGRLRDTLDSISDAFFVVDESWRLVVANRQAERLLGGARGQLIGQAVWKVFPGWLGGESERHYRRAMRDKVPVAFEALHPALGTRAEVRVFPGDEGLSIHVRDVTEQHRAVEQLRLLNMCVDKLSDVVMITDARLDPPGPTIVFVNAGAERFCGYRPDELIGRSPRLLQGERTDRFELDRIRDALSQRRPVRAELVNYAKSGSEYWVEMDIAPVVDEAGQCTHFIAIERDTTARRAAEAHRRDLEAQLRQAQKMESLGTLAGGIAHDFNNILSAMLGHVEFARADLPGDSPALASLSQIRHASLRARALVQQILAFSRRQVQQLVERPLAPIVEGTVRMLRATLPAGVRLELRLSPCPLVVRGDANQLEQVLINLCTNAWHALGGRAETIVVGMDQAAAGRTVPAAGWAPGYDCWAHLWVSDSGSGMDSATRSRLFEPFFTTKPVGQGTGLGLAVVHGIVGAHGGEIDVESEPGRGSTFHVYLPARRAAEGETLDEAPAPCAAACGSGQRVLYVDDDDVVLLMAEELLKRAGFVPSCHADPREALRRLENDPGGFDVVVTDYNMPGLSGADVTKAVRRIRADLPVIMMSGFVTEEQHAQARVLGALGPLDKQNCLEELSAWIVRATTQAAAPI